MFILKLLSKKEYLGYFYSHNFDPLSPNYSWNGYLHFDFRYTKIPVHALKFPTLEDAQKAIDSYNSILNIFPSKAEEHIKFLQDLIPMDSAAREKVLNTVPGIHSYTISNLKNARDRHYLDSYIESGKEAIKKCSQFKEKKWEPYEIQVDEMLRFDKRQQTARVETITISPFTITCNCCGVLIPFKTAFSIRGYKICPMCVKSFADNVSEEVNDIIANNKEYIDRYTAERVIQLL